MGQVGEHNTLPLGAKNVHILLVDHDTCSLLFLTSKFEQQSYRVTATESANVALSLFRDTCYDAVIADRHMPKVDIYEFVHELHRQQMKIPIMLIDKNQTPESVREAIVHHRVCYVFSKPLSHRDIVTFWHHIPRVAPTPNMQSDIDARNLKRNVNNDGASNSKKPRIWTPVLHKKFLDAIDGLGEDATPKNILGRMKDPDLKYYQVASHLQKHRNDTRHYVSAGTFIPSAQPAAPHRVFLQGQTSGMQAPGAPQILRSPNWLQTPNLPGYGLEGFPALNHEPAGASADVAPSSGLPTLNQELAGATSSGLRAPNLEPAGVIGIGNGSEGSGNQLFDGMQSEDDADFGDLDIEELLNSFEWP